MYNKLLISLAIFAISIFASIGVIRTGYFSMHDDLQIMRLDQFSRCFQEGQIPCRIAPDMSFGYGQPTFSYYSSFPYYLGGVIHTFGVSHTDTVKLLSFISFLLTAVGSYLLSRHFFAPSVSLFVAGVAVLAPYRLVDVYVRGALSEVFAISLLPLVIYALIRLRSKLDLGSGLLLSISLFAFFTTHLPTLVTSVLPLTLLGLYLVSTSGSWAYLRNLTIYSLLGFGLSAYFLIPIFFERSLIDTSGLYIDYYDYRLHFVSLAQLIFHRIGYGPSRPDTLDEFNLSIGYVYLFSLVSFFLIYLRRKSPSGLLLPVFFLAGFFLLAMNHARSDFVYQALPIFQNIQFPWRFLGPLSVFLLPVVGYVFSHLPRAVLALSMVSLVIFSLPYLRFEKYDPHMTDDIKLSGENFIRQSGSAINDYLPKSVAVTPTEPVLPYPVFITGEGNHDYSDRRGIYYSTEVTVYTDEAIIRLPFSYFPNLDIYLDRSPQKISYKIDDTHGQPEITLSRGKHLIQAYQTDTPIRLFGNIITFVSFIILVSILYLPQTKKHD
jgi:hypothetical protein